MEKHFLFGTRIKRLPICLFVCFARFSVPCLLQDQGGKGEDAGAGGGSSRTPRGHERAGVPEARESSLQGEAQGVAAGPDRVSPLAPEAPPSSHWGSPAVRAGSLDRNPRPLHGPRDGQRWSWYEPKGRTVTSLCPCGEHRPWVRLGQQARGTGRAWSRQPEPSALASCACVASCVCVCARARVVCACPGGRASVYVCVCVAYGVRGALCTPNMLVRLQRVGRGSVAGSRRAGCWPGGFGPGELWGATVWGARLWPAARWPWELIQLLRVRGSGGAAGVGATALVPIQPRPRKPCKWGPPASARLPLVLGSGLSLHVSPSVHTHLPVLAGYRPLL